jgi:hypothetical protein
MSTKLYRVSFWVAFSTSSSYKRKSDGTLQPLSPKPRRIFRLIEIAIFTLMHVVYAIILIFKHLQWNIDYPGECYDTRLTGSSNGDLEEIYIALTTTGLLGCMLVILHTLWLFEICESRDDVGERLRIAYRSNLFIDTNERVSRPKRSMRTATKLGIVSALSQFPLHMYMMVALRISNQHLLMDSSENQWGFGQSLAIVMMSGNIFECFMVIFGMYLSNSNKLLKWNNFIDSSNLEYQSWKAKILTSEEHKDKASMPITVSDAK